MRSIKLLVAAAIVGALVAGPVLAQDAGTTPAPASDSSAKAATPAKHKHTGKKKHAKKSTTSSTTAPATTAQ